MDDTGSNAVQVNVLYLIKLGLCHCRHNPRPKALCMMPEATRRQSGSKTPTERKYTQRKASSALSWELIWAAGYNETSFQAATPSAALANQRIRCARSGSACQPMTRTNKITSTDAVIVKAADKQSGTSIKAILGTSNKR